MSDMRKAIELLRRAASGNSAELREILGIKRAAALHQALREPRVKDLAPALCSVGWSTPEVDFLELEVQPGEGIKSFDVWSVTTSAGRVINRGELRSKYRPGSWTRVDTWLSQFPPIPNRT